MKITETMQKVAVDILERFYFVKDIDEVIKIIDEMEEKYQLWHDPFVHMPCTAKEYSKSVREYERQLMEEKYGYYE